MTDAAPGWYPDPRGGDGHRYWTGDSWAPDETTVAAPIVDWSPAGASAIDWSSGGAAADGGTAVYPAAYAPTYSAQNQFDLANQPMPSAAPRSSPWQSAAAWLAVAAALIVGFGAGYFVADARAKNTDKKSAQRAAVSASASPAPASTPTPSSTPEPTDGPFVESDQPPAATPSPDPSGPVDRDAGVLGRLGLRPTDVDPSAAVSLIPHGDEVVGTTTLDLCDGSYPSELHRTARRQVVALTEKGDWILSTEAVLYDTAESLDAAFKELKTEAARCAKPGIDKSWPQVEGVERVAYDVPIAGSTGAEQRTAAVYMRHGRTLLALYFRTLDVLPAPIAGQKTVADATAALAKRLAAIPTSAATT
ncbi:MAG: hypothetical protein ABI912_07190 [Actinomycetota bacterium]